MLLNDFIFFEIYIIYIDLSLIDVEILTYLVTETKRAEIVQTV
jgi:hypothetical protein